MSEMTDYLENELLDHAFGKGTADFTSPPNLFVILYTAAPGETGGGTEVSGGSYARTAVTFAAASGGNKSNTGAVTFPTATANWGDVSHFGIIDASSAGNLLMYSPLDTTRTVNNGDTLEFANAAITITFA